MNEPTPPADETAFPDAATTGAAVDAIDVALGLTAGDPLHALRRRRRQAVEATQASQDALLDEPVDGLSDVDRRRIAVAVAEALGADALARGLRARAVAGAPSADERVAPLEAFGKLLATDPHRGDRAAIEQLAARGASDGAIVAVAQLVGFLSYQARVVAGLAALRAAGTSASAAPSAPAPASATIGAMPPPTVAAGARPALTANGFTDATLGWSSWLTPVDVDRATPQQLAVLDASHPQARASAYYRTLVHQPAMLQQRSTAYNAIMYAPGGLPRAERELAALATSVVNGCVFCASVHAQRYQQLERRGHASRETVRALFEDRPDAGDTPRERAIVAFARALTQRPQAVSAADIAPLRDAGLDDAAIIDAIHAAAIFGWANRLMHNLGEPVDG